MYITIKTTKQFAIAPYISETKKKAPCDISPFP
jgi:hypothetical protein